MYLYNELLMNILHDINTVSCTIKVNSNTIELTMHTSCYCVLDLLCVKIVIFAHIQTNLPMIAGMVIVSKYGLGVVGTNVSSPSFQSFSLKRNSSLLMKVFSILSKATGITEKNRGVC